MDEQKYTPDVEGVISQILEIVNKMPLDNDGRIKIAQKLIREHITDNPDEQWVEDNELKMPELKRS